MLKYAFDFINENKQAASLYSFPFVKPVNVAKLLSLLKRFDRIITIEEHQLNCGFGSAVLEIINDAIGNGSLQQAAAPQVKRVGINDTFYSKAGSQQFLRKLAGIQLTQDFFIQNNQ
jgi:transketolase